MRQLKPMDAFMYYLDSSRTPFHISALSLHEPRPDGPVTLADVAGLLEQRLHLTPPFRQRLVTVPLGLDHPYWVDDRSFQLHNHIQHVALPKPGDWNQLRRLVARLHARPLDLSRPPWEIYLIDGLDHVERVPGGGFALLIKVHHAAIDGVAGAEMLSALFDRDILHTTSAPEPWTPEDGPSVARRLAGATVHVATRPTHLLARLPHLGRVSAAVVRRRVPLPAASVPRTRFNGRISGERAFDALTWSLSDFKRIRAIRSGSTVNDVALAVIAGALRRYLLSRDELPASSLWAMVPISLRSGPATGGATKAAAGPQVGRAIGNETVTMAVRIHTDEPDDTTRFIAISASAQESKERKIAIGASSLTDLAATVPGHLLGLSFRTGTLVSVATGTQPFFNTMVTNVPGSPVPLYFCGAQALNVLGLGPLQDALGLVHIVGSYNGQLGIHITADPRMLPDIDVYLAHLRESYESLLAAAEAVDGSAP